MKKAVQLYSIRLACEKNLERGLKEVSALGYDGVEFAGFFGNSAETVAGWLKKYNLEAMGAHVGDNLIFDTPDDTIAYHKAIGNTRIICPYAALKSRADVEALAAKLKAVAPKFKANGMQLYYHNHSHEFTKDGGKYLIDILADLTTKDELMFEFDVYWVYRGGESPSAYMKKYTDRIDLFHSKDGDLENGTVNGKGLVDLIDVYKTAKELDLKWTVIESEADGDEQIQLDDIKECIQYVNTIL